jgi:hypothetical protein
MPFRVFWSPYAEDGFEQFVTALPDPKLLASAARRVDQALSADPIEFGESRYDAIRIGFAHPIGIQFEVMQDVQTVIVHSVWLIDRR